MKVSKCKWKYGAEAPVMFMIDDLCNKYMTDKENGNYVGADWGGKGIKKNSFWHFLNTEILSRFPHVKVTMFLVVGKREPITKHGKNSFSEAIDKNKDFIELIDTLLKNKNIELAYHGLTHGLEVDRNRFIQEWKLFKNLDEAINTINQGKEIYKNMTKYDLRGGKYCGYEYNEISDESISITEFKWWCRHWEGGNFLEIASQHHSYELEEFDGVVDIPTTIDGSLFSLKCWRGIFNRGYVKAIYYKLFKKITIEDNIKYLIKNQYVISIQEHTSPYREDGKIQYPNVVSDKANLIYLFKYLKNFDLWYATGSEIEKYYRVYKYTEISYDFEFITALCKLEELENEQLTIKIQSQSAKNITLKNKDEEISLRENDGVFLGEVYPRTSGNKYKLIVDY